jgi:hypothetical protein
MKCTFHVDAADDTADDTSPLRPMMFSRDLPFVPALGMKLAVTPVQWLFRHSPGHCQIVWL